jgi:hypothetical protein
MDAVHEDPLYKRLQVHFTALERTQLSPLKLRVNSQKPGKLNKDRPKRFGLHYDHRK